MKVKKLLILILFLLITLLTTNCEDDSVSSQEDHFEAIGTLVYDATGALAVSILRGETNDTLFIVNGELSDAFTIKFYDEDENIVDPPEDPDVTLNNEIGDDSIVEFWQHEGEEGGFEFHLRGLKQGVTNIELFIAHEGHNDYRSGEIPVVVR